MAYVDSRSPEAATWRKLYSSARWRRLRAAHLAKEPVCRMCLAAGRVNDGTTDALGRPQTKKHTRSLVVDHIEPHKGDLVKFWTGPFQTLCHDHHVKQKQIEEQRGYSTVIGEDGFPVDPNHPGNRAVGGY